MTKQEIIDYIMTTPSNPNKAVLDGMLDSFSDDEGGGGGSSRILLYENDALDISTEGSPGIHFIGNNKKLLFIAPTYFNETDDIYTLEIDGEIAVQGKPNKSGMLGIKSPGDTDSITADIKAGVAILFTQPDQTQIFYAIGNVCINDNFYSTGTHSVKFYKEA